MDLARIWERFTQLFGELGRATVAFFKWVELTVWAFIDRFVPEAREGYPYVMWDVLASVGATTYNNAFPAASFTNNTTDEFVVQYLRFEGGTDDGIYSTGGTVGGYPGAHDFNLRVIVRDLVHNSALMQTATPIGLLIEPGRRVWKPARQIILPGGQNGSLGITVDNVSGGAINNVYCAVHGYMRTRKNQPQ